MKKMHRSGGLAIAACALLLSGAGAAAQQSASSGQSGSSSSTSAQPGGKHPPQAKSQEEFDAYKKAAAITDPAAFEKAAEDFSTKFPQSELRILLFKNAMRNYQNANNPDKMLEMSRKALQLDPDDPEALISVAEVLSERTRDTDTDKQQKLDEATKDAQRAIETVDTDSMIPAGTPQAKIDEYKATLKSTAWSIIGAAQLSSEKYADAEASFHKSIDAYPANPDPVVVLRLAIALDKQNKYPEALKEANKAVDMTQENTNAGTMARRERDRLVQLTGGIAPAPSPSQTPSTQPAGTATPPKSPGF